MIILTAVRPYWHTWYLCKPEKDSLLGGPTRKDVLLVPLGQARGSPLSQSLCVGTACPHAGEGENGVWPESAKAFAVTQE